MRKALIVDDDPSAAQLIARFIAPLEYESEIALSGLEAIDRLRGKNEFDVVISDVRMPYGSGIDVLREMPMLDRRVPIILISAEIEGAKLQAKALGADGFLLKPVTRESLADALKKVDDARPVGPEADPQH